MILPSFLQAKVLVVGDVMLDRYWHGEVGRISPEAPVPVVNVEVAEERPGGAANVAMNIAALGGQVTLFGRVGTDEPGIRLTEILERHGVTCEWVFSAEPTVTKLRVVGRHQQLMRLDFEKALPLGKETTARFLELIASADVIIFSDYAKGFLHHVREWIKLARAQGKCVLVDPKHERFEIYEQASVLTPNWREFQMAMGACPDEELFIAKGKEALQAFSLEALIVTRGEKGLTVFQQNEEPVHLRAQAREVFDITGAGDTVIGVLGLMLAAQQELVHSARIANYAAGLVVAKLGTATITRAELENALTQQGAASKIIAEKVLIDKLKAARNRGERIVFTNGCFDILHLGHITYLEQAKALGQRLIVALNDDASVRRLKGDSRPVNPLFIRERMMAALGCVDWVVAFSEDTPERIIKALTPDILVKGGDYRPEDIVGAAHVQAHGGEVHVLPFVSGFSTTNFIAKLKEAPDIL